MNRGIGPPKPKQQLRAAGSGDIKAAVESTDCQRVINVLGGRLCCNKKISERRPTEPFCPIGMLIRTTSRNALCCVCTDIAAFAGNEPR